MKTYPDMVGVAPVAFCAGATVTQEAAGKSAPKSAWC